MDTNEVVISGMSGRFPESNNVQELIDALYNGINLSSQDDRRHPTAIKGMPHWMGKVPEVDKFDASFFDMHHKQANFTDPRHRILLETVYEAIVDSGYNPAELKGSKTGVFVGMSTFTNVDEMRKVESNGYSNLGMGLYSAANRISRAFDFKGPSMSMDTACSSAMYSMILGYEKIKSGEIENAVACGTHLLLDPEETKEYNKIQVLTSDRYSKVFNKNRSGFVRSEAVCCVFMQRKPKSRRIYATVLGAKGNSNGLNPAGFTVPCPNTQFLLMNEVYTEGNINPDNVTFMEIHGTGTVAGDSIECEGVTKMFYQKERKQPLLIGSIKCNTGHCENSSAIVSTIKVLSAMESGVIPANINAEPVDLSIMGIKDGKLKVVTKNTEWTNGLAGISSYGIGGSNGHAVFKRNDKIVKPKVNRKHRLVQVSGRTEEAVNYLLDQIEKNQKDEEFLGLLDEIHKLNIERHNFRGYAVFGENSIRSVTKYKPEKRPIVFIYSGIGTQWPGMGKYLMGYEVFRNTFNRCAAAVKPYGVDLQDMIMGGSETALEDIGNTFTAIGAIHIALTEFLYSLGIRPDFFAGHSSGEVGCSYANGDLTPEQAVLLAYARGHALKQEKVPLGQMAAVGLSKDDMEKLLPKEIFVACQNGKDNVSISGPAEVTKEFVKKLKDQNIFAHLVNSGGYAFHTKYIWNCYDHFLEFARKIVPNPKPRSNKWISTSVPPEGIDERYDNLNCAEYQANNFRNKVLFDQIYSKIPTNAMVIEVSPNGIFQSILKRELGPDNILMTLTRKNVDDHEQFLLAAIGKIYNAGGQPNLRKLYKETVFPVSRGTKMIGPLVKWDHSTTWYVPYWQHEDSFGKILKINISEDAYSHLKGHNIDGRNMMPAFYYMEMVWKVFAAQAFKDHDEFPVVFENVTFIRATILPENETVEFIVNIMKQTGHFEIFEGGSVIVTGTIRTSENISQEFKPTDELFKNTDDLPICKREDFYKDSRLRRMHYSGVFQGILECDVNGYNGTVEWKGNFSGFLDSISQMTMRENLTKNLILPLSIKKLVIDPDVHIKEVTENQYVKVRRDPYLCIVRTKGIEVTGLEYDKAPKREKTHSDPLLETCEFIPYDSASNNKYDVIKSFAISLQIILQNTKGLMKRINICEIENEDPQEESQEMSKQFKNISDKQVSAEVEYTTQSFDEINTKFDAIVVNDNISKKLGLKNVVNNLRSDGGFVIYIGQGFQQDHTGLEIVFKSPSLLLLKPKQDFPVSYDLINIRNADLNWLDQLKQVSDSTENRVAFLFSQNEETSGIVGLLKCLMTENTNIYFKAVLISDKASAFSVDDKFYKTQLSKLLSINVLKENTWGTFIHLPLDDINQRKVNNAIISTQHLGDISALNWVESPKVTVENNSSELVNVHYSALNTLDTQVATAKLRIPPVLPTDADSDLGFEYSGVTQSGKKVMGIVARRGLSYQVKSDPELTWEVPNSWSLEEAATVPVTYALCYFAMVIKGHMERGETILINASQEFGMVAIPIAQSFNSTIFMSVQTQEEKDALNKLFPKIEIGLAKDPSLPDIIKKKTNGKGLDLILSTVDNDLFNKSLSLLSTGGRILDLSKSDSSQTISINPKFLYEYSYHCICLDILLKQSVNVKGNIRKLVEQGITSGIVNPISSAIFKQSDVVSAFKRLASSTNTEKVLIKLINGDKPNILATPKIYFDPNKSYIIIGGLGGMGLELTDWMLTKGARKVILNGRRNIWNGYQSVCMRNWSQFKHVEIKVDLNDAATTDGAEKLIKTAQKLGPVGGLFNLGMVLRDANITDQTVEDFKAVLRPKLNLSENLDVITRKQCPLLDHFVLFSSVSCGRGNLGQTNYGMANSAMERLCEKRRKDNLPGLAVQWGPVGDVGVLSSLADEQEFLHMLPQKINSCFDSLEKLMVQGVIVGASTVVSDRQKSTESTSTRSPVNAVANILGIENIDSIDKGTTLSQLGLDSLMITEIKQTLYRNFQIELGLEKIRTLTFESLANVQVEKTPTQNLASKDSMIPLLNNSPIIKINDHESQPGKPNIFMIAPVEGYIDCLKPLAKNFKVAVFGLQSTRETNFDTVRNTANYFMKFIKNNQKSGPYLICGYSYGAVIGFEIGLLLEQEGHEVQMVLIDGSPDYAKRSMTDSLETQNRIFSTFTSFFTQVKQDKADVILKNSKSFEDSLNSISQLIAEASKLNLEEVKFAAESYWDRCKECYYYNPSDKFKGKILLIRRMVNTNIAADDYELEKHCHQKVEVRKINGDHYTILLGNNLVELSNIAVNWLGR